MGKARVEMYSIEELLRLDHECGCSQRETARSSGLSAGAVNKLPRLAGQAGLAWPLPPDPDDAQLRVRLYGRPSRVAAKPPVGGDQFCCGAQGAEGSQDPDPARGVAGVPQAPRGRVQLQPVLRAVGAMEVAPLPSHAARAQGGREVVC